MAENNEICYTGEGAKHKGKHTKKQFMDIMKKKFTKKCAIYIKSLRCNSCKKSIKMNTKEAKKQLKKQLQNKPYKMSVATEKKLLKIMNTCSRCKNKYTKKCNINNYMSFSGAEYGKCDL